MAQHISVRVPWHDVGYCGKVCKNPCNNGACLRLKNIFENRNDEAENALAGKDMKGHERELPCLGEGGAFMCPEQLESSVRHPYAETNPTTHGHFLDTPIVYPPFSLPTRPFRWLMATKWQECVENYNIHLDVKKEPVFEKFTTMWIQDADNHRAIFKYFYHDVIPHKSLCLIYAKQVPFIEDTRRVIIGLGFVDKLIPAVEHKHTDAGDLRSMTWENMVCHTIRSDFKDGFLFPYQELMDYAKNNPKFDISTATVFASDEYRDEFSYATEHVSYDAVIDVLLQSLKVLHVINEIGIHGNWVTCINWVKKCLKEVWQDRGAFPGLGPMLCAANFPFGILMAEELKKKCEGKNVLDILDKALANPSGYFSSEVANSLSETDLEAWKKLPKERKELFKLLTRFSFSIEQATNIYRPELRSDNHINCTDAEIIANPYTLYEKTRNLKPELQISIHKVDLAAFANIDLAKKYPLHAPSAMTSTNDKRRIRALSVSVLESQATSGNTIYPLNKLILDLNALSLEQPCSITGDNFQSLEDYLKSEIITVKIKEKVNTESGIDGKAYQLSRLYLMDEKIRSVIRKRVNTKKRHVVNEDWAKIVNLAFGKTNDKVELKARQEKTAILKELAESRFSVLVGGAGTGKTTLLSLLCSSAMIQNGGILVLAPTGKARVKLGQAMASRCVKCDAKTVAQFLISTGRYNPVTMTYRLSNKEAEGVPDTVIVDECSMLTEEMYAALLEAIHSAKRIIFVGDPNQLPPIGAGRPFVDTVHFLNKDMPSYKFPKVCNNYGELTITRRQKGKEKRLDIELAKWYANSEGLSLDENVFSDLQGNVDINHVVFKEWENAEGLESLVLKTLAEELNMKDADDIDGFDRSLGANITAGGNYFNKECAKHVEAWQILAPVRNMPHGVFSLNHLIHLRYRESLLSLAKNINRWKRKIPSPLGQETIVYGDKVINVVNNKRDAYPKNNSLNYVANGEVGIATCKWGEKSHLNVVYSSQPDSYYSYTKKDFGEEHDAILELAYALTIHKSQGSEFKKVILVLNEPCYLLSRELLYTAITRQTDKLIILYNKDAYNLRDYTSAEYSEIARRFTNLFDEPYIINVNDHYYEAGLIHHTNRGELVRSKSEVIIANALYDRGINYAYERKLQIGGVTKLPDFTIDDPDTGETFYWEHCGMLSNPEYKAKWEAKKAFYAQHGIVEDENLIVTQDDENGSIDSRSIVEKIEEYLK